MQDVDSCSVPFPRIMAIGGAGSRNHKENSGVLFINVTALDEHHAGMVEWGIEHSFPGSYDQDIILGYFNTTTDLDQLPDKFNWKVRRAQHCTECLH
jgi:hypothetical protein